MIVEYKSYQELCSTPEAQADFLEELADRIVAAKDKWEVKSIMEGVKVADKPLSIGKYMATLELSSGDWEREDENEPALRRFVAQVKRIEDVYPDIKPSGFVFNWDSLPRVDAAPRQAAKVESFVSAHIVAPTLGQNVSNGAGMRIVPTKPAPAADNAPSYDGRLKMRMG